MAQIQTVPLPRTRRPAPRTIDLMPNVEDRAILLGINGSGKTTLAVYLLTLAAYSRPTLIMDCKGEDQLLLPGALVVTSVESMPDAWREGYRHIVYRPDGLELADPDALDAWCQWCYDLGDAVCYIDELSSLQQYSRPKPGFLNLLARGRRRQRNGRDVYTPLWMSLQRGANVPVQARTECKRVYCFELADADDRLDVARWTAPELAEPPDRRYGYWYYNRYSREAVLMPPLRF